MGKGQTDNNTLGLVGDGDELDVVRAVEEALGVTFAQDELSDVRSMGDLHQVLVRKLNATTSRRICLSSVTFYRLRRALRACGIEGKVTPSADIAALTQSLRDPALRKALERESGLRLPGLEPTAASDIIVALVFLGGLALAIALLQPLIAIATLLALIALGRVLPRKLAKEHASMRGLANASFARNFAVLSRAYGQPHADDVWKALKIVVRDSAGTGYTGEINEKTRFI